MPTPPPQMPQFQAGSVPVIGQRQKQAEAQLMQAVGQMGTSIFIQLASAYIAGVDRPHQTADRDHLQQLARDSQAAAKAYFEGLGIAQFSDAPPKTAEQGPRAG